MMEEKIKSTIQSILDSIPLSYKNISFQDGGILWVDIDIDEAQILIGKNGETLRSFNYLVEKILEKEVGERISLTIDINGYKKKERDRIIERAKVFGDRVKNFKVNMKLDPMSGYERLIIHEYFSHDPHIVTESEGEGRDRRIVLKYSEGEYID